LDDIPYGQWFANQYEQMDLPAEVWALAHVASGVTIISTERGDHVLLIRKPGVSKMEAAKLAIRAAAMSGLSFRIQLAFYSPLHVMTCTQSSGDSNNE